MRMTIKKVGYIRDDGFIVVDTKLIPRSGRDSSQENFILEKINGGISHSDLLRKLWRKMKAEQLKTEISRLMQEGIVAKKNIMGQTMYYRTSKIIVKPQSFQSKPRTILTDLEIEEQKKYPIKSREESIWAYKDSLFSVTCDEYAQDEEIVLHIQHYMVKHDRNIREIIKEIAVSTEKTQTDISKTRRKITEQVKMYVWRRDNGKCVECGRKDKLEFDHIIPFSKGGSNTHVKIPGC